MSQPVHVTFYGDDAAKPEEAMVQWTGPGLIQVVLEDRTEQWIVGGPGFAWELSAGALRVMHGQPRHTIMVRDPQTVQAWTAHFKSLKVKHSREGRVPLILGIPMMIPVGFIAVCVAAYVWLLPIVAERIALSLPMSTDVEMGDALFASMKPTLTIDEARSATLQAFGDQLQLAPSFKLKLHVVTDEQVNAFAMPGGHIVVYSGILQKMKEPGELVALLAHEGTHVEKRHTTRNMARALAGTLFISWVLGDVSGISGTAAQKGDELQGLHYSRELETEADTVGMARMAASGVDPQGMVKLLQLLEREGRKEAEEDSFLSSHPLTKDRIALAEARVTMLGSPVTPFQGLDSLFGQLR